MSAATLPGLVLFAVSMTGTPGPNIVMLTSSGANFGFRRTMPHMAGVSLGFPIVVLATGLGLGSVLAAAPELHVVLQYLGMAYLLWLAFRIATARRAPVPAAGAVPAAEPSAMPGRRRQRSRPFSFIEALLFQWVNPKAWVTAVAAIGTFAGLAPGIWRPAVEIATVFLVITLPIVVAWAGLGTRIGAMLRTELQFRCFNVAMATLLVLSLGTLLQHP